MLDKSYSPAEVEKRLYEEWEKENAFAPKAEEESSKEKFCIMIPPPNVTGSLHMGHALNFTIQDILVRYNRMCGKDTMWQPGTDHAGIATQMVVERKLAEKGITRHDLGREKFIEKVWEWKKESGSAITKQLRRLGSSLNWERERFTMDEGLSKAVSKVFVELHKKGLIYRDKRLVNWDPKLHTAISDLEVEQRETVGKMWYFKYPVEGSENEFITVGTTRPETMLGDTAVAVHEDDERYKHLVGKNCILPIMNKPIPVVTDEHADPEKGTGAVKITPAHDFNDFEVGRRNNLDIVNILDMNALLNENAPAEYQGLDCLTAREKVVAEMESLGLLVKIEDNPMTIPYGDRSGVVIEPWLTDQWFVDAEKLAQPAIKAVEDGRTKFVPKNWENTYFEWMRNIQPWCISRQLWWGHRIPVWYGEDGKFFCYETEKEASEAAAKHYGKEVSLTRDEDVLDTWFSSGLWAFTTLGWPKETPELKRYYPTQTLVTGFDIIFFWVARMMMMSLEFTGEVPFDTVYIHALVRDEKGQKMSKSKGNVVDPLELMDKYGTDSLRFTMAAMAAQGRDVKMSENRIQGYRNFATKLWNAARFCEMNECKIDEGFNPKNAKNAVNQWIISKTSEASVRVSDTIDAYRFNESANAIYQFAWGTFCDWYVEFTKPVFYGDDEEAKKETRATAAWVLDRILIMLHPFMPFITEELWGKLSENRPQKLIHTPWIKDDLSNPKADAEIDWVVNLITQIRSVRSEMNVPPSAKIPMLIKGGNETTLKRLESYRNILLKTARLEKAEAVNEEIHLKGVVQVFIEEATILLPLADVIDLKSEITRLEKEIGKHDKEIEKITKKLSNKNFTSKAPEKVIKEQKRRLEEETVSKGKKEEAKEKIAAL